MKEKLKEKVKTVSTTSPTVEVSTNQQQQKVEKCLNPDCQKIISKNNPRIIVIRGCASCAKLIEERHKQGFIRTIEGDWERIEVAQGLIDYNFAKYEISYLKNKFSYELIKKCLCKEWGVRQLKSNIQRLIYEVFLLEGEGDLPANWEEYDWPLVQEWELDHGDVKRGRPACPFAVERQGEHRKGCECFKPEMIEGWVEEMGEENEY